MSVESHPSGAPAGSGLPTTPTAEPPPAEPIPAEREETAEPAPQTIDGLAAYIVEEAGRPIDVWAIAALLESAGTRDLDAVERYGLRDVFALALAVEARLPEIPPVVPEPEEHPALRARLRRSVRPYGRGIFFIVPLTMQLIALLAFGISQFASVDFTVRQASVVALATGLSFAVSAGFVQSLGYLAPIFEEPGKHILTRRLAWRLVALGTVATAAAGLVLWALAALLADYTAFELRIGLAYYALMAVQALVQAILYLQKRYGLMLGTTAAGIGIAVGLHEWSSLAVHSIHYIALAVGTALMAAGGGLRLRRQARATYGPMRLAQMPRGSLLARRALPFAIHGTLYFVFLFLDRLIAWASGPQPLPFWFRPPYELGLAGALGAVVLAMAFLEITVERFSERLMPAAERYRPSTLADHNRSFVGFWARQVAVVGAICALGAWLIIAATVLLDRLDLLGPAAPLFDDPGTHWAFAGGVVGYALLTIGLTNSTLLLSLARPRVVIAAMVPALLVDAAVGIVLTTHHPYYTAVLGLVAGALVFAVVTGIGIRATLRRTDYWSYAAW